MSNNRRPVAKGCAIVAAVVIGIPLLIAGVVGVQTWVPLQRADDAFAELEASLGNSVDYTPSLNGSITADRMELFLELRAELVGLCEDYGTVQQGFDSVESLDEKDAADMGDVGGVALGLGGAALEITPFLAKFFEARNEALLAATMGLQEYSYIYAISYHERLLSNRIRNEIFSDGVPLSPEASVMLRDCLERQELAYAGADRKSGTVVVAEIKQMTGDPTRLIWQDELPAAVLASVAPYRTRLDALFCSATAGLEMEQAARRAIRIALE